MTTLRALLLLVAFSCVACSQTPVAADSSGTQTPDPLSKLDDDDVRIRFQAVERLREYLQVPVISYERGEGCFFVEAPSVLECSERVEFCTVTSGTYVSGNTGRDVAWAYPKDPPAIFTEDVFFKDGMTTAFGSGQIPGGIPLLERFRPEKPEFACGELRPGARSGSAAPAEETEEEARRRQAEERRLRQEQKRQREEYETCIEELEEQRQEVRCEVVFVNPCRKEAFMMCREHNPAGGRLHQIDAPRDELLRITWEEGTEQESALFTVEMQTAHDVE